jgi:diacylglycerol kinase
MLAFLKSFVFAFKGLLFAWEGRNFRIQIAAGVVVTVSGLVVGLSTRDWMIIIIMIGLVLAFEVMNSALEQFVNLVSPDYHPLAGKIKDMAAGAVLILSIVSVVIGVLVFWPYIQRG